MNHIVKSSYKNRWDKLSKTCTRFLSPCGDGLLPIVRYVRDPKSGQVHKEITGYNNLQDRMNEEAKSINLLNMLAEVEAGNRERVKGFSNASVLPSSKYEAEKRINNLINLWDRNPLLRLVYGSKESLLTDLNKGVDVFKKVKTYSDGLLDPVHKEQPKKEEVKQEPKKETSDGAVKSEVK